MAQTDFTVIEVVKSQQDEEVPEELYTLAPWWEWMFVKTHFYFFDGSSLRDSFLLVAAGAATGLGRRAAGAEQVR